MELDGTGTTTIVVEAHGRGQESTHVETEHAEFVIGTAASPLEHLLGSLAACLNVIGHLVAAERGMALRDIDVTIEADIDPRTYRGEATESRAGFRAFRVGVTVDTDAEDAAVRAWMDEVEQRCPVADNLKNDAEFAVSVANA